MLERLVSTAAMATALCVGLVFLAAGAAKLRHRRLLPGIVANYRLLPGLAIPVVAFALPVIELGTGLALVLGERRFAPPVAIGLLLLFAWAMAVNIRRGRHHIHCGCGSQHLRQTLSWSLVARNLVLALALAPALATARLPAGADLGVALGAGLALYLLYHLFHALQALATSGAGLRLRA